MAAPVAVVIITRDRWPLLAETLERLDGLPERPPVVVVDNGSTDRYPPDLRRRFPDVRVIPLPENRGAAARTVGVRAAGTEFVGFADDDSWWAPGSLARAGEILESEPGIGLLAARVVVQPAGDDDPTSAAMARGPLDRTLRSRPRGRRAVFGCLACGSVVRSSAYLATGGFPATAGVGGEEQMLVLDIWAAGWQAVYAADVVAYHRPAESRDVGHRRRVVTRNDLRTAWARLPVSDAMRATARVLGRAGRDPLPVTAGLLDAVGRFPAIMAGRVVLPPDLARARRATDS